MRIFTSCLLLLVAGVHGMPGRDKHDDSTASLNDIDDSLTTEAIYGGWVNPEDLSSMPQCIAQQDQSAWLSAMTKCTEKKCTRHFGVICTHHQWLTELSCLSIEFSPDLVNGYLPYCSRSILAEAQLYQWIHRVTGRTWLVAVGDSNRLQQLSPRSLTRGYEGFDIMNQAPTCLTSGVSAPTKETFQRAIASCSFTGLTEHTGNAARPWEYRESMQSMVALDFETAGYNLTGRHIYGEYFDKECFCRTFTVDLETEPCSKAGHPDLTSERLWIAATCGPDSLPGNWTDELRTTDFAYIPTSAWTWPKCHADMPKQVTGLVDQCEAQACELDSSGYCVVKRAVDRACFCRGINYTSCGGSCHDFDTRSDYVDWLHHLCGGVEDWHGLPDNWPNLRELTALELIPWRWTVKASKMLYNPLTSPKRAEATGKCVSNGWKLASIALVNMAYMMYAIPNRKTGIRKTPRGDSWQLRPGFWILGGLLVAAPQLFTNLFSAVFVQMTPGYASIPVVPLTFLWATLPRPAWVLPLLVGIQPSEDIEISAAAPILLAELILQLISSYCMVLTLNYTWEHHLSIACIINAERGTWGILMYAGAFMWLATVAIWLYLFIRTIRRIGDSTLPGTVGKSGGIGRTISGSTEERAAKFMEYRTLLESSRQKPARQRIDQSESVSKPEQRMAYGTIPIEHQSSRSPEKLLLDLYPVTVICMVALWIAQWVFWVGFIFLSSDEFCPPNLGVLTAMWSVTAGWGLKIANKLAY